MIMNAKRFFSIILTILLTLSAWAGNNILSVRKDIKASGGKTVFVPIELTNDDEIVAAQFNITLPFAPATVSDGTARWLL